MLCFLILFTKQYINILSICQQISFSFIELLELFKTINAPFLISSPIRPKVIGVNLRDDLILKRFNLSLWART